MKNSLSFHDNVLKQECQSLPAPEQSNAELSSLVVGTVLNLLVSIVEQGSIKANSVRVMSVLNHYDAITGWLW